MNLDLALSRLKTMSADRLESAIRSALEQSGIPVEDSPCNFHFCPLSPPTSLESVGSTTISLLSESAQNFPYEQCGNTPWMAA